MDCSIKNCNRIGIAYGLCRRHYDESRKPLRSKTRRKTPQERLEDIKSNYKINPKNGCHEWCGPNTSLGYGFYTIQSSKDYAHRLFWEITFGPIPDGKQILHKCDNRCCVNPDHLYTGTQKENVEDMVRRGRHLGGHKLRAERRIKKCAS